MGKSVGCRLGGASAECSTSIGCYLGRLLLGSGKHHTLLFVPWFVPIWLRQEHVGIGPGLMLKALSGSRAPSRFFRLSCDPSSAASPLKLSEQRERAKPAQLWRGRGEKDFRPELATVGATWSPERALQHQIHLRE
eukprot:1714463-Rhodomonas_salina.1